MHINVNCVIVFIYFINYCVCKKYYNYTLYRGVAVEDRHMDFLKDLQSRYDVIFWRPPGKMFKPVDFVVSPEDKPSFLAAANKIGVYLTTIIEDVQKAFDEQTVKPYIRRRMETFDWNNFFRLNDIYEWLQDLAVAYPQEMVLMSIGKTHENRDIMAAKIVLKGSKLRSKVIVEGGIHAREWIAPAVVTYLINQILLAPTLNDANLLTIAQTYEWHFVPVVNPDGYEYSHTENRLWRKNRHGMGEQGVDLNRNFDHAFGSIGVSFNDKSEVFCGPSALSENESRALAEYIRARSTNIEYYLAFHSYGQHMIIPYADSKRHHDNFDTVKQMCNQAKSRIALRYNTRYSVGTAYDTVGYATSGVSGCWVKKEFRVPYVVTFELRDSGHHGFALPPKEILPTCQETMDGVLSLLSPRTSIYQPLRHSYMDTSGQPFHILDKIVIVFNAFLFIIVRFD